MKRLYVIKNAEEISGDPHAYVVELEPGSFSIIDEAGRQVTFKFSRLESLFEFEDLTMDRLEPVQE